MAEVIAQMRAEGYRGKLPQLDLTGRFGTALMKLASHTRPAGAGSYLRSHLGRVPRHDTGKAQRELGMVWRTPQTSLSDTLADLAHWGHIPAAQA